MALTNDHPQSLWRAALRGAFILVMLCACLGLAQAQDQDQDQSKPTVFPQLGHSGQVVSVAFSPNGTVLASGSGDKTIKLWDVASGRELRTLSGHKDEVRSVAFSPDGKVLASGSDDYTIKLWDVASGRLLRTLSGPSVISVAFSPDSKVLASGSDKTIKLWDVASGRELRTLSGHTDWVHSVAFSPDGKKLVSGSSDGTIKLWDEASGRELRTLNVREDLVTSVAFSPDGKVLASACEPMVGAGTIKLWDVASGRELRTLRGHTNGVDSVAFSPDGKVLASGSLDHTIKFWDVASGRELRTLSGDRRVTSVAFSPDGKALASGGFDRTIKLWDVASGRKLRTLSGHVDGVMSVAFSPDGKALASGGFDATIKLWDVASGRQMRTLSGHTNWVTSVAFSPDGKALASGSLDDTIKLWDVASGRELSTLNVREDFVKSVAFSPDGKALASGSGSKIKLWDVANGRVMRTLISGGDDVSVAFSPNGKVLAGSYNNLKLWDVASGRELHSLSADAFSVAFSPDGKVLASGSFNKTIKLWDVASGRELRTLSGHTDEVRSVTFSPDGKVLASGGRDNIIKLWDVASGRELRTLVGNLAEVSSVAFSRDGKVLASGSEDGTIREWDPSSGNERVKFIAFDDGSSLAITPEGYYDASSGKAEENLNVRIGNRVFAIGSYREKFYRPDLVKLSLAGESLTRFGSIDSVKLAPVVELIDLPASASESKLSVTLRLTDGGGGIGLVRLFLNGTAVVQDEASVLPPSPGAPPITRSYMLQLASGTNALRAVAYNADHSMQSNPAVASINLPLVPHATLHAVVVGIQEFKNPRYNLQYPVKDAQLFAETLSKYSAPLFQKVNIKLLITPAETTRESLMQSLKDMHTVVQADDLFVFYVASHGLTDDGEYFLITSNVGSASTEHLKTDAVSKEELTALVSNIAATKKLLVIDTCQAEALGNALQVGLLTRGLDDVTALKILSRATGTTVLAASTSTQEALEGYQGHGLFTFVVAEGLMGKGDVDKNGYVSTFGLAHYVDGQVPNLAESQFQRAQYPTVEMNGQQFPLTKVK